MKNNGIISQFKSTTQRNCASNAPPAIQPRKGILMSPSHPLQISPPPPPPTSSIPKTGNLKHPIATTGQRYNSQKQSLKFEQYCFTQQRPSSADSFSQDKASGRPCASHPPPHQLTRGRKLNAQKTLQQRLKFECEDMRQIQALNKRLASLTIADMSPKLALHRILLLCNRGDHRYQTIIKYCLHKRLICVVWHRATNVHWNMLHNGLILFLGKLRDL